jgi:hypothetical protein
MRKAIAGRKFLLFLMIPFILLVLMGAIHTGKHVFKGEIFLEGIWSINGTQVTSTATELNKLDGVTSSTSEINTLDGVTSSTSEINTLDLSTVGAAKKYKTIGMTASDFSDDSEVDTTWDLPAQAIVTNVFLDVDTKEDTATTKTVDVGTNGSGSDDPNGFLVGASVGTAGLVAGDVDMTDVDGGDTTLGALLVDTNTTNDTAMWIADTTSGGESITVTAGDGSGFTEADFDIVIEYIEISN